MQNVNNTYDIFKEASRTQGHNLAQIFRAITNNDDYKMVFFITKSIIENQDEKMNSNLYLLFKSITNSDKTNLYAILRDTYDFDAKAFRVKVDTSLPFLNADDSSDNFINLGGEEGVDSLNVVEDDSKPYLRVNGLGDSVCSILGDFYLYTKETTDSVWTDIINGNSPNWTQSNAFKFNGSDNTVDFKDIILSKLGDTTGFVEVYYKSTATGTTQAVTTISRGGLSSYMSIITGATSGAYPDESLTYIFRNDAGTYQTSMYLRKGEDWLNDGVMHKIKVIVDGVNNRVEVDGTTYDYASGDITFSAGSSTSNGFLNLTNVDYCKLGERNYASSPQSTNAVIPYININDITKLIFQEKIPLVYDVLSDEYCDIEGTIASSNYVLQDEVHKNLIKGFSNIKLAVNTVGDSNTFGTGLQPNETYPYKLNSSLSDSYIVTNEGVHGWRTSNVISYINDYTMKGANNLACVMIGTNDILWDSKTATDVETNLTTIYNDLIARGFDVVAMTILPIKEGTSLTAADVATYQPIIDDVNTWITTTQSICDAIDVSSTIVDSDIQADGIHMQSTATTKIAAIVDTYIDTLTYTTYKYIESELNSGLSVLGDILTNPTIPLGWNGAETQTKMPTDATLKSLDTDNIFFDGSGNAKNVAITDIPTNGTYCRINDIASNRYESLILKNGTFTTEEDNKITLCFESNGGASVLRDDNNEPLEDDNGIYLTE